MSYEFYYDALLQEKELTFRLVGKKSAKVGSTGSSDKVEVILRDFIKSNLSVSISHSYQYGDIGLAQIVENLRASWADIMNMADGKMTNEIAALLNALGLTSSLFQFSSGKGQIINVPPSDYFKTFTGTDVSLPLTFNSRIYSRVINNVVTPPVEILKSMFDYVIGDIKQSEQINTSSSASKSATYYSYGPPHGYNPHQVGKNWQIEGGLTLYYGNQAIIDNLVLKDFDYTFSREVDLNGSPLYVDITFTLIPALMIKLSDLQNSLVIPSNSTEAGGSKFKNWVPN